MSVCRRHSRKERNVCLVNIFVRWQSMKCRVRRIEGMCLSKILGALSKVLQMRAGSGEEELHVENGGEAHG